jgi:hypothetical protein
MSINKLRRGIFWRTCAWGVGAGMICGGGYGTFFVPVYGTLFGAVIGVATGLVLGILNGLYLGIVSVRYYYPLLNLNVYQRAMTIQCLVLSLIGSAVVLALITFLFVGGLNSQFISVLPLTMLIPAFIAGFMAMIMSWDVTEWYKIKLDSTQRQDA